MPQTPLNQRGPAVSATPSPGLRPTPLSRATVPGEVSRKPGGMLLPCCFAVRALCRQATWKTRSMAIFSEAEHDDRSNTGIQRDTMTEVLPIHDCILCVICSQAEAYLISPNARPPGVWKRKSWKNCCCPFSFAQQNTPRRTNQPAWSKIRRQRFAKAVNGMAGAASGGRASLQLKEGCCFSYTETILLGGEEARNGKSCRTFTPGKLGEIGSA